MLKLKAEILTAEVYECDWLYENEYVPIVWKWKVSKNEMKTKTDSPRL